MAYTTIDDPTIYFNTVTYAGDGTADRSITGVGFQPDWVWIKNRSSASDHVLFDAIRGVKVAINSNDASADDTISNSLTAFNTDGFSVSGNSSTNTSSANYVGWSWLAGGTAPAITYTVKVVSDSGNKYRFDDFGTSAVTLDLQEGGTYTFDQSDSSNSGHPLRFSTTSDGSHGGGSEYTTGVTTTGTPGSAGAKTVITVAASAPTLYYYCTQHSGMGGQANTNSLFGSSNFLGSIQSNVSAGSTQGFSVVSYSGNGTSGATVGHGLGVVPKMIIAKRRDSSRNWTIYHQGTGNTHGLTLNTTDANVDSDSYWNDTTPSSTVFTLGNGSNVNNGSGTYIAYCFSEKKGYSKFGSYTGNGSAEGTFVYTGFKPAWLLIKSSSSSNSWYLFDNKREGFNVLNDYLSPNTNDAEITNVRLDLVSNGFKLVTSNTGWNGSGTTFIYMAFAESPFVNSNGVPTNAR
tara:strand:+ start:665 stop:2047 length:1383 start_codon:yes stop_codon:yes gene_type:complete